MRTVPAAALVCAADTAVNPQNHRAIAPAPVMPSRSRGRLRGPPMGARRGWRGIQMCVEPGDDIVEHLPLLRSLCSSWYSPS